MLAALRDPAFAARLGPDVTEDPSRAVLAFAGLLRAQNFINRWHANRHESEAMWKLYGGTGGAIALRMSYAALAAAPPQATMLGMVRCVDDKQADFSQEAPHAGVAFGFNSYDLAMHKRASSAHEQEVRALIRDDDLTVQSKRAEEPGRHVPFDLNGVDHDLLLSPSSPPWLLDSIQIIRLHLGLKSPIRRSTLFDAPDWPEGDPGFTLRRV